ncbi:PD-(D/E)XK nuclease-like domain-containing protein [Nocardia arizonensis]|uniref:PD-(D/E)XK nuclease-like domain-containing protein n=1 Tax=Nocardia arizonensis TaxID=1141647 RepID=UPI0007A735B8|nr:PD-(D/E)XK nuclease-like domain-containing protein [Nocardia arizonensis]
MTAPTIPGVYAGVPEKTYHGDRASLSSSGGRRLLELAPAEWLYERDHPEVREPTPDQEFGTAVHTAVLGVGARTVEVKAKDWKKPADQQRRKVIRARGDVPLLSHQIDTVETMAEAVLNDDDAGPLLATGTPELSAYGHDPATGVLMRARTDWMHERPGGRIAVDLKTAESSSPEDFAAEVRRWAYHVQQAWYELTFAEARVPLDAFVFVVVAKRPPHLVAVHELKPRVVDLGRDITRRALDRYARCIESDSWPGHGRGFHQIDLPDWEFKKELHR